MAIRSKDELLSAISTFLGDNDSDDALRILEDVTDTLADYDSRLTDSGDWKRKYEENDADWRKRYRERFNEPAQQTTVVEEIRESMSEDEQEEETPRSFDELFEEKVG